MYAWAALKHATSVIDLVSLPQNYAFLNRVSKQDGQIIFHETKVLIQDRLILQELFIDQNQVKA